MTDRVLLPTLLPIVAYMQARDRGFSEAVDKVADLSALRSTMNQRLAVRESATLVELVHRRLGSRDSSLILAEQVPLNGMGNVGLYLASAARLGELLSEAANYLDVVRMGDTRVALLMQGQQACLTFMRDAPWTLQDLLCTEIDLGCLLRLLRHSLGRDFRPDCIRYPAGSSELPEAWQRDYGVPTEIQGPHLQLCFPRADLERPTRHANAEIRAALKPSLDAEMRRLKHDTGWMERVVGQIVDSGQLDNLDLDSVSHLLAISSATLNRRLAEENTEFSHLVQAVSREHALRRLLDSEVSIEVLAGELGYADPTEFEARFRQWMQVSPARLREESRAAGYLARSAGGDLLNKLPNASRACEVLLGLQQNEDASMADIADIIGADPVLAARVVGVAGSAMYGGRRIRSVQDAASVLGMNELRRLAAMMALRQSLQPSACPGFDLRAYWVASLALSQLPPAWSPLAKGCRFDDSLPLTALLCEIGTLLFACSAAAPMQAYLATLDPEQDEASVRAAECTAFGTPRYALASLLLARWNVVPEVVRQVRQLDAALDPAAHQASMESLALLTLSRLVRRRVQGLDCERELAALRAGFQPPAAWAIDADDDGLESRLDQAIERCREQAEMMLVD